jgi:hypothetical protein
VTAASKVEPAPSGLDAPHSRRSHCVIKVRLLRHDGARDSALLEPQPIALGELIAMSLLSAIDLSQESLHVLQSYGEL